MAKIIKPQFRRLRVINKERKKPRPRKKMIAITVYDCPMCGTELEKAIDPDVRVLMTLHCPNCDYCY